jgi:hypothetical protein
MWTRLPALQHPKLINLTPVNSILSANFLSAAVTAYKMYIDNLTHIKQKGTSKWQNKWSGQRSNK